MPRSSRGVTATTRHLLMSQRRRSLDGHRPRAENHQGHHSLQDHEDLPGAEGALHLMTRMTRKARKTRSEDATVGA